ncbi:MAG: VWA domain-containing protein [Acidobacteriota bacterium]|nr:VWA domain-containing protein [Acidobacteriota bacterium]
MTFLSHVLMTASGSKADSCARHDGGRLFPMLLTTFLCFLAALITVPVQAQMAEAESTQAQAERFGDRVEVQEVLIDALVTDGQGKAVLGLDKDDFIVREEGEPVEIQDVTFYTNRRFLASSDDASTTGMNAEVTPINRYFILFFHHQRHLLPRLGANLLDAGHRAQQWVRSLQPDDYVAVVSYFPKYNLLDFTNDADVLTTAIDQAIQGKDFAIDAPLREAGIPSLAEYLPKGDVDRIYEALAMTAEAAGAVRGRKNLVLFSIGFGEVDSFGFYRPDTRYYPEMIQTLNDNNVAVYPVDLLATDVSPSLRANRFDHVLSRMAWESSGEFYFNFTNYLTPLEQVAEDNTGYYLISFAPHGEQQAGEYQEVEVETLNSNFEVKAREGYVVGDEYAYGDRDGMGAGR